MKKNNKAVAKQWMRPSVVMAMLLTLLAIQTEAQTYDLSARNTSLDIDVAGGTPGLSDWTVNGVNQLDQQWFYYSVGGGDVNSIDTIGTFSTQYENFGNSPFLNQTYSNSTVFVTTDYTLQSQPSGSGQAKLSTLIGIQNESQTTQTFNFYIYSDFWLGGNSGNQNFQFSPTAPYEALQTSLNGGGPLVATITGISGGMGDSVEEVAGIYDGTQFGLINGDAAPSFTDSPLIAGAGNVDFAYEVSATLTPGTAISFTDLEVVPEPSSGALILSGMFVFGLYYGRKLAFFKKFVKKTSH